MIGVVSEWLDIETAPKDGTVVLVAWPRGNGFDYGSARWDHNDEDAGWIDEDGGHWLDNDDIECAPPTHWMPLPAQPQVGSATE